MNSVESKPNVKFKSVTILSNTEISPNVFLLSFKRDFAFRAGQVLGIAVSSNDDARLYSIASGENDENISLLYNIKPGGKLTPNLAILRPDDTLWITVPFGTYAGSDEPAYWIAAGTGIAPFYSMYRSGLGSNKILIHGSRTLDAFYFSDELLTDFGSRYVRCCSQQEGEGTYHGRVTQYLEALDNLPEDQKYYLCGSAEMVVECREILLSKGVPFSNVVAEIYF
ncbi:MAG: FAD-binding oxidoreductase [Bacteroidales bacterium]|nr:FAD-binding oxidoreductase [Bacteroidales bacterium]